jgi:serine protein kinase
MDLQHRFEAYRSEGRKLAWTGTFSEYFDIACANPRVADLAHARIYNMIRDKGVEETDFGHRYTFFDDEIFGADEALEQITDYFRSSAARLEVRKRILLLVGPPGSGKSTLLSLLKRELESYTRSDAGAVYAIRGCPMHEEPLHLIPKEFRDDVHKEYGLYIEGDLCPWCQYYLDHPDEPDHPWSINGQPWSGKHEDIPIDRIAFSEKLRVGIGTYQPSDPKSQDISELVGGIDLATVGKVGSESDPRGYRFDGELNISNRGIMEFIEILKTDDRFLYILLSLSQEQNIKTGRYSMIYADEAVLAHTNEHEYKKFKGDGKHEAMQDRIIKIEMPYNLRVSDEVKTYEKLLSQSALENVHIAPKTLETAATWAILTRLEESRKQDMTLMKKLKLYDGESVDQYTPRDVKELKDEADREGMFGISPRYVINRLSSTLVQEGTTCINPIDALRSLGNGLSQHTKMEPDVVEQFMNLRDEARREYEESAKTEVQKAFVYAFDDSARTLLDNYLLNVEAFCNKEKVTDPITEEEVDPDEQLMRGIEEQINVSEASKKAFREEVMIRLASLARRGERFTYESHEQLKNAIEKQLFADLKDVVRITTSAKTPDEEQLRRINDVADRLIEDHGYCSVCANELLKFVGQMLNR